MLTLSTDPKGAVLAAALVEHCLHPRALLSPMDADYCARMIKVVHRLGTPGFSTLNVYDKVRPSILPEAFCVLKT